MERIGVIGLGRMGSAIAARCAARGAAVTGWTRSGLTDARARELGIVPAPGLSELVAASDVIVTSLFDDRAVCDVIDALLQTGLGGRLIVETSTAVPTNLTDRAGRIAAAGADVVDAPIPGGPEMVAAGTCAAFVGGTEPAASRAQAVLALFAARIVHVGPLGTGLVMKTLNNGMIQAYVGALRELLPAARRAGRPLETALSILNAGPAGLPMIRDRTPRILGHDDSVGFTMEAALKDNLVFQQVARALGVDSAFLRLAETGHRAAIAAGHGARDPGHVVGLAYGET